MATQLLVALGHDRCPSMLWGRANYLNLVLSPLNFGPILTTSLMPTFSLSLYLLNVFVVLRLLMDAA